MRVRHAQVNCGLLEVTAIDLKFEMSLHLIWLLPHRAHAFMLGASFTRADASLARYPRVT